MQPSGIAVPRMLVAGLVAGAWVVLSGILMAAAFGYRDMSEAFARIGLAVPQGAGPMIAHTAVRLGLGLSIAVLFALIVRAVPAGQAVLVAAGLAWLLGAFFPYLVVTEWGLFGWGLAVKIWAWSAGEFLIASVIARLIYDRP